DWTPPPAIYCDRGFRLQAAELAEVPGVLALRGDAQPAVPAVGDERGAGPDVLLGEESLDALQRRIGRVAARLLTHRGSDPAELDAAQLRVTVAGVDNHGDARVAAQ